MLKNGISKLINFKIFWGRRPRTPQQAHTLGAQDSTAVYFTFPATGVTTAQLTESTEYAA